MASAASTEALALDSTEALASAASASQDGAGAVPAVAAVAASDKQKEHKGRKYPVLFCFPMFDDLYSDVKMTLREEVWLNYCDDNSNSHKFFITLITFQ